MERCLSRRVVWAWIVLAMLLSAGRHIPLLDSTFDTDWAGIMGGRVQGPIQMVWYEDGIFTHRFRPITNPLPTTPMTGPTYGNHPTLFHYIEYLFVLLFGLSELSLRIYPMIGAAVTCGMLVFWSLKRWGHLGAGVALLLQLLSMGLFHYGSAANYESTVTIFVLAAFMADAMLRGRKRYIWLFIFSFLATTHDWIGGLIFIGLLGKMIYHRSIDWRALLASWGGAVLMAVLHYALLAYWEGGFDKMHEAIPGANKVGTGPPMTGAEFFAKQVVIFGNLWGWTSIPMILLIWLPKKRLFSDVEMLRSDFMSWMPILAIWIWFFKFRSWDHEFWGYTAHPGVFLIMTGILVAALKKEWRLARPLVMRIALGALVIYGSTKPLVDRIQKLTTHEHQWEIDLINSNLLPSDILVYSSCLDNRYFYLNGFSIDEIVGQEDVETLIGQFLAGEFPERKRLFYALHPRNRTDLDHSAFMKKFPRAIFQKIPFGDLYLVTR